MPREISAMKETQGEALRQLVLTTPPGELGFTRDAAFPSAYGILMDWDVGGVVVTVMALRDGTANLYSTSTFGVVGGGDESVREATDHYVRLAGQHVDSSQAVSDYPYPETSQVYFYILTYDGVRRCMGDEPAIKGGSDPTRDLYHAAQAVLTELRQLADRKDTHSRGSAHENEDDSK